MRIVPGQRMLAFNGQSLTKSYVRYASSAKVLPPKALYSLDGTYATALWTAACKAKSLETVAARLSTANKVYTTDNRLANMLENPSISKKEREDTIRLLSGGDNLVDNFLKVLAENNRVSLIPEITNSYEELMKAHRGEIDVTITSSQKLDPKTMNNLQTAIQKSALSKGARKLNISNRVNESILGGLVVEIGDRTIDLSVSSKIAKINRSLTDAL